MSIGRTSDCLAQDLKRKISAALTEFEIGVSYWMFFLGIIREHNLNDDTYPCKLFLNLNLSRSQ